MLMFGLPKKVFYTDPANSMAIKQIPYSVLSSGLIIPQKHSSDGTLETNSKLTGSTLQEEKTQANATAGVVTFSANITTIEILNTDTVNTGVFTVNEIPITVPPTGIWKDGVGGTPGATVTVAGSTAYILHRFS